MAATKAARAADGTRGDSTGAGSTLRFSLRDSAETRAAFRKQHGLQDDNFITTAKYTKLSFLPKFLWEAYHHASNQYFTFDLIIQLIPGVTPVPPITTATPLAFVLGVSGAREAIEDVARHKSDVMTNSTAVDVLRGRSFETVEAHELQVGDVVRLRSGQAVPADVVLLSSSSEGGVVYNMTANLDGETNLKQRRALEPTAHISTAQEVAELDLALDYEQPNDHIHHFFGQAVLDGAVYSLDASNVMLRGSVQRNTGWSMGAVIYTGRQTRLSMNQQDKPSRLSTVETQLNRFVAYMFLLQFVFCATDAIASVVWKNANLSGHTYLGAAEFDSDFVLLLRNYATYFILYAMFIPISLFVTIELVRFAQALFMRWDIQDTDENVRDLAWGDPMTSGKGLLHTLFGTVGGIKPRTSNLNEDLGVIEFVFSDKTGTLTRNEMKFHSAAVGNMLFNEMRQRGGIGRAAVAGSAPAEAGDSERLRNFLLVMSLCHSVVPELIDDRPAVADAAGAGAGAGAGTAAEAADTSAAASGGDGSRSEGGGGAASERKATAGPGVGSGRKLVYQSESTDELSLVECAADNGVTLLSRSLREVRASVRIPGVSPDVAQSPSPAGHGPGAGASGGPDVVNDGLEVCGAAGVDASTVVGFPLLVTLGFTAARRRMSVVVRLPDGRIMLLSKGADSAIFERLATSPEDTAARSTMEAYLERWARRGLRTLTMAVRELAEAEFDAWKARYDAANAAIIGRDEKVAEAAEELEQGLHLVGCTAIEDRLQDRVPETIQYLRRAGTSVWVLTGDKQSTAISIGKSCRLITPEMDLVVINAERRGDVDGVRAQLDDALSVTGDWLESQEAAMSAHDGVEPDGANKAAAFRARPRAISVARDRLRARSRSGSGVVDSEESSIGVLGPAIENHDGFCLVTDGDTLSLILDEFDTLFLDLVDRCHSVIVCRATPLQKSRVVGLVQLRLGKVALAIGDGANDVNMIQQAHVGVGVLGHEGTQAAQASDYAICQFQHLQRLMSVHGRYSYLRIAQLVRFSFYKNMVFTLMPFWMSFRNGYTGQTLHDAWIIMGYNIVFTSVPPFLMGLFEKDISEHAIAEHPAAYKSIKAVGRLQPRHMAAVIVVGGIQSAVLYYIVELGMGGGVLDRGGTESGLWTMSVVASTTTIIVVMAKVLLMSLHLTLPNFLSVAFSLGLFVSFLVWYTYSGVFEVVSGVLQEGMFSPTALLTMALACVTSVGAEAIVQAYSHVFHPTGVDILREQSKMQASDVAGGVLEVRQRGAGAGMGHARGGSSRSGGGVGGGAAGSSGSFELGVMGLRPSTNGSPMSRLDEEKTPGSADLSPDRLSPDPRAARGRGKGGGGGHSGRYSDVSGVGVKISREGGSSGSTSGATASPTGPSTAAGAAPSAPAVPPVEYGGGGTAGGGSGSRVDVLALNSISSDGGAV